MIFRMFSPANTARLALSGIALCGVLTYSQAVGAQFSKYNSPYGSYGGYKQFKQYDPYKEYDKPSPSEDRGDMVPFRRGGGPLLAVVALDAQRVTVYDSNGRMILQSPISTGTTGYETPAGIFSVVQKKADHNSNLYEDGNMPFMQRITWTGIALHAGVLPGHPASHGCVRMPMDFARRLFDLTDVGMRVVIVRNDIALADFDHPQLFKSNAANLAARPSNTSSRGGAAGSPDQLQTLKSIAASRASEAEAAGRKATELRRAAARRSADAASATKGLKAAEASHARADAQLKDAEKALEAKAPETSTPEALKQAETAKEKAAARLAEAEMQLQAAKSQAQAKIDAATAAESEAKAAEDARDIAQDAASEAKRRTLPVSVFVSRKAQRYYVRQGYEPVFEGPITIRDPDKSVGSYVFTAFGNADGVRWRAVSMYADGNSKATDEPVLARNSPRKGESRRNIEAASADVAGAKAALDRIAIPHEALRRISDVVLPGSSLIVSDEGLSIETGKDTDFVIVMSGEPQGALKVRQREPRPDTWGSGGYGKSPFGGFFWKN